MNSPKHYQHYSPFSQSARKWIITIGSILFLVAMVYALSSGTTSYLNY